MKNKKILIVMVLVLISSVFGEWKTGGKRIRTEISETDYSANWLIIENNLSNRYAEKIKDRFSPVIQGFDFSVKYVFKKVMFGIGTGPLQLNGFARETDSVGAFIDITPDFWGEAYYVFNFRHMNSLLCLGGKAGKITDSYYLAYVNYNEWPDYSPEYNVRDTYYNSIGMKYYFGFKYMRISASYSLAFGLRKESIKYSDFDFIEDSQLKFTKSYCFDIGITAFIGPFRKNKDF